MLFDHPTFNGTLAAGLMTSHFWGEALQIVSTSASFIATVCGAIIGVITVSRMVRSEWQRRHTKGTK